MQVVHPKGSLTWACQACAGGGKLLLSVLGEGKMIFMKTENLGVSVTSISTVKDGTKKLYIALTGDQCAISNIRISQEN